MFNVMECFHRLTPMHKCGVLHWKCFCTNCFRKLACRHTALFSAPWDPEVRVPAGLSEEKIPNSKGKLVPTVFNADKMMEEEEQSEPAAAWQPKIAGRPDQ
jgi:hypothetical protein